MEFIQHCRSMKEAGFQPKMVYRNLPPSHLYEKVRFPVCGCLVRWRSVRESSKSSLSAAHWPGTRLVLVKIPYSVLRGSQRAVGASTHPDRPPTCCRPCATSPAPTSSSREPCPPHLVSSVPLGRPLRPSSSPSSSPPPATPHLAAPSAGAKTGRCPRDKRVVRDAGTEKDIWWASSSSGSPNYEMDERSFLLNRETAVSYLNSLHHVFVFDGFANWDPEARIKVCVCARACV